MSTNGHFTFNLIGDISRSLTTMVKDSMTPSPTVSRRVEVQTVLNEDDASQDDIGSLSTLVEDDDRVSKFEYEMGQLASELDHAMRAPIYSPSPQRSRSNITRSSGGAASITPKRRNLSFTDAATPVPVATPTDNIQLSADRRNQQRQQQHTHQNIRAAPQVDSRDYSSSQSSHPSSSYVVNESSHKWKSTLSSIGDMLETQDSHVLRLEQKNRDLVAQHAREGRSWQDEKAALEAELQKSLSECSMLRQDVKQLLDEGKGRQQHWQTEHARESQRWRREKTILEEDLRKSLTEVASLRQDVKKLLKERRDCERQNASLRQDLKQLVDGSCDFQQQNSRSPLRGTHQSSPYRHSASRDAGSTSDYETNENLYRPTSTPENSRRPQQQHLQYRSPMHDPRLDAFSPGTKLVAEISKHVELNVGQHAPLSLLMDREIFQRR